MSGLRVTISPELADDYDKFRVSVAYAKARKQFNESRKDIRRFLEKHKDER